VSRPAGCREMTAGPSGVCRPGAEWHSGSLKRMLSAAVLGMFLLVSGCAQERLQAYGVFLGINQDEADRLDPYRLVVIEPSEFSTEQIAKLHAAGKTVYGYLNIGAIEEYRPCFNRFRELFLGVYEDWPDERWVDVASPEWQSYIVDELGGQYAEMGFDGLFLDNADIYYQCPTEEVFQGLGTILQGLKGSGLTLIVNGGDLFVSECIDRDIARSMFDGVNQECVFTRIDFAQHSCGVQEAGETEYFKNYLSKAKQYGLAVYLLEYQADENLAKRIDAYCAENAFLWYNAEGPELR